MSSLPSFANQVAGHRGISHEGGAIRKIPTEPGKIAKPVGQVRHKLRREKSCNASHCSHVSVDKVHLMS